MGLVTACLQHAQREWSSLPVHLPSSHLLISLACHRMPQSTACSELSSCERRKHAHNDHTGLRCQPGSVLMAQSSFQASVTS